jgi:hypothetical protein
MLNHGPSRLTRVGLLLLTCGALVWSLFCLRVQAQDKDVVAAASAFARGQQEELRGDHARAAELFELADRIAPTPEALRSATRARLAAGETVAAAQNAEQLVRRYEADESSRELARRVLAETRPLLTRLTLECSEPCTVVVDGLASSLSAGRTPIVYLTPGSHQLGIGFDHGRKRGLRLRGAAAEERTLRITPPARSAVAQSSSAEPSVSIRALSDTASTSERGDRREASALSPTYLWLSSGLSVASVGLTLWSGLDLLKARAQFRANPQPTRAEFEAGERKDLRTSILLGASGALVVSTVVLACLPRRRATQRVQSATVVADRHSGQLMLGRTF